MSEETSFVQELLEIGNALLAIKAPRFYGRRTGILLLIHYQKFLRLYDRASEVYAKAFKAGSRIATAIHYRVNSVEADTFPGVKASLLSLLYEAPRAWRKKEAMLEGERAYHEIHELGKEFLRIAATYSKRE